MDGRAGEGCRRDDREAAEAGRDEMQCTGSQGGVEQEPAMEQRGMHVTQRREAAASPSRLTR